MKFKHIVRMLVEETTAADQARQLGLEYGEFGRWLDPKTGKVVARTIDGKLVKVTPGEEEPSQQKQGKSNDLTMLYDPSQDDQGGGGAATSNDLPMLYDPDQDYQDAGYTDLPSSNPFGAGRPKIADVEQNNARYRNPSFYTNPPSPTALKYGLQNVLSQSSNAQEFAENYAAFFDLDPDVQIDLNSSVCDEYAAKMGSRAPLGVYHRKERTISVGSKVTQVINKLPTLDLTDLNNQRSQIGINVLYVLVHESIHAKDSYLTKMRPLNATEQRKDTFWNEGLTDTRAVDMVSQMIAGDNKPQQRAVQGIIRQGYETENNSIRWLDKVQPGTSNAMWEAQTLEERLNIVEDTARSTLIQHKTDNAADPEWQEGWRILMDYVKVRERYDQTPFATMFEENKMIPLDQMARRSGKEFRQYVQSNFGAF